MYRSLTQRAPFLLAASPRPLPTPHACAVHHAGGLDSCSDFSAVGNTSHVVLACDASRREWSHTRPPPVASVPKGALFLWDASRPSEAPRQLAFAVASDFHPLAVAAVDLGAGRARVFATNSAPPAARVEVVDVDLATGAAELVTSVAGAAVFAPAGVAAVSATSFFVANSVRFGRMALLEVLVGAPTGSVVHVTLGHSPTAPRITTVARLNAAKGIAVDPARGRLWVASMANGINEYVFDYDSKNSAAVVPGRFHRAPTVVDNLLYGADGHLYAAAIVGLQQWRRAYDDAAAPPPPSWALQMLDAPAHDDEVAHARDTALRTIDPANGFLRKEEWRWRTAFTDDGGFYGGVSAAGLIGDTRFMAVGLLARGVVLCEEGIPVARIPPQPVSGIPHDEL